MQLRGSYVALVTPFDRKGRLDRKSLEKLLEWHVSEGTDGIVCCATTGESPTLSDAERRRVSEICLQTVAGRIPVIVSTGTNDTRTSVKNTEMAKKLGAQGCLVVTPYYNKPSQQGCYLHFQEVAKVGLPVILYHIPGRAIVRLTAETIEAVSKLPNVIGIKESSGDLELVRKISKFIPVLSGDDDLTLQIIRAGGVGSIGVIPNVIPSGWKRMIDFCLEGKWGAAEILYQRYLPLCKSLFLETNPQCVKFALSWLGRCQANVRLPMVVPGVSVQQAIQKEILCLALPFCKVSSKPSHF